MISYFSVNCGSQQNYFYPLGPTPFILQNCQIGGDQIEGLHIMVIEYNSIEKKTKQPNTILCQFVLFHSNNFHHSYAGCLTCNCLTLTGWYLRLYASQSRLHTGGIKTLTTSTLLRTLQDHRRGFSQKRKDQLLCPHTHSWQSELEGPQKY